jgi:hypothetical protein
MDSCSVLYAACVRAAPGEEDTAGAEEGVLEDHAAQRRSVLADIQQQSGRVWGCGERRKSR